MLLNLRECLRIYILSKTSFSSCQYFLLFTGHQGIHILSSVLAAASTECSLSLNWSTNTIKAGTVNISRQTDDKKLMTVQ